MKLHTLILPFLLSCLVYAGCNNNNTTTDTSATDTTSTNPTENAEDYHPDQRQSIPATDSSNVVGTDTIGASGAKGTKDTTHQ